jgi:hypothetical protein
MYYAYAYALLDWACGPVSVWIDMASEEERLIAEAEALISAMPANFQNQIERLVEGEGEGEVVREPGGRRAVRLIFFLLFSVFFFLQIFCI